MNFTTFLSKCETASPRNNDPLYYMTISALEV